MAARIRTSSAKRILFVQYANSAIYPPVSRLIGILAGRGWEVEIVALSADAREGNLVPRAQAGVQLSLMPTVVPGWLQKFHFLRFIARTLWIALRCRPDWLYVSDVFASPAGLLGSLVPGVKVAYHEHDWPAWSPVESRTLVIRLLLAARRALAQRADVTVFPNAARNDVFARGVTRARRTQIVQNCPLRDEVDMTTEVAGQLERVIIYQGSINELRVSPELIVALARVPGFRLRLVGYETAGSVGCVERLLNLAAQHGVAERVEYRGALAHEALREERRGCMLGWSVLPETASNPNLAGMVGASCKAFEYMASGIVPIVSSGGEWQREYADHGLALACDGTADDIARVLRWCAEHPDAVAHMGDTARDRIVHDWNYEREAASLIAILDGLAAEPSPSQHATYDLPART